MGLSQHAAAEQAQRLSPSVQARQEPAERGHRRGQTVIDPRRGGDAALRGIPLIGVGAGAISGTKPGPGASGAALDREARELNEHGRLIARERMQQARDRLRNPTR